jgi:putative membrane protein
MDSLQLFATYGLGFAFGPLIWILLIVGIVLLLLRGRRGWDSPEPGHDRDTAVDVLERRFAEGEISLEQYRERRAVLEERR